MNKLLPSVKSLITLAALLCFLFQASAASAQKVSLSVRNATVKAAIERLQKDYGYSFVIKTKDADVNKKITLDVKNEEIGAVVGKMFAGQNVVSSVEGKMIAIMSAPAKRDAAARASANAVVKGVVKDSAGNPITGATGDRRRHDDRRHHRPRRLVLRTDRGAHGCPPDRLLPRPEDQGGCGGRSGTVL